MLRKLGTHGPEVSALGFGCMGLNYGYGPGLAKQEAISFAKDDFRNIVPRFSPDPRKANQGLVESLASIAETKRATPDALSLIEVQGDRYPAHLASRAGK